MEKIHFKFEGDEKLLLKNQKEFDAYKRSDCIAKELGYDVQLKKLPELKEKAVNIWTGKVENEGASLYEVFGADVIEDGENTRYLVVRKYTKGGGNNEPHKVDKIKSREIKRTVSKINSIDADEISSMDNVKFKRQIKSDLKWVKDHIHRVLINLGAYEVIDLDEYEVIENE